MLRRWWLVLVVVLTPLAFCGAMALVRVLAGPERVEPFPPVLVPPGGAFRSKSAGATEQCYAHEVAFIELVNADAARRWAESLDLRCSTPDAGSSCTSWSTARRSSPFWAGQQREPNGLDTVEATLNGATLRVDWGDYLCSGWN